LVDVRLLDRLQALQQRRRWLLGLRVGRRCRHASAALIGFEGRGLSARAELFAHLQQPLPSHVRRSWSALRAGRKRPTASVGLLAAQLAECLAGLLDEMAGEIAPAWDRVLAVAVDAPGFWSRQQGLTSCQTICDTARLAELCGQNVIDDFAGRDLAVQGRARPLSLLPDWLILHDRQQSRLLVCWGRRVRTTYLPASRDSQGALRTQAVCLRAVLNASGAIDDQRTLHALLGQLAAELPPGSPIDEVVLTNDLTAKRLLPHIVAAMHAVNAVTLEQLRIAPAALVAARAAVLGQLHLDQTPGNLPAATGAQTSRVLGRLTPGSLPAWHRLVRELAAASPSVMPLRSAL